MRREREREKGEGPGAEGAVQREKDELVKRHEMAAVRPEQVIEEGKSVRGKEV